MAKNFCMEIVMMLSVQETVCRKSVVLSLWLFCIQKRGKEWGGTLACQSVMHTEEGGVPPWWFVKLYERCVRKPKVCNHVTMH